MLLRRVTLLLCVVASVSACGVSAGETGSTTTQLAIGELPAPVTDPPSTVGSTRAGSTTTLAPEDRVGVRADGNRIILIGDSVMASTSRRYSNDMCNALVPLGWQVEVDAETGRFIEFGRKVLDKRLSAGWDVSVILLGNNYAENQDKYRTQLEQLVERLSPNPVLLLTVTEFKPSRAKVNEVILQMAATHDNVSVVDWAMATKDDPDLTGADGLHLTTKGRQALAEIVALTLGDAPEQPGDCLKTSFSDDSSGPVTGTTVRRHTSTTTSDSSVSSPDTTVSNSNTTPAPTDPATTEPTVGVTSPGASVPMPTQPPASVPSGSTPPPSG